MHARNEHASQIPALAEIPVGLKIMPQNTPTVWRYTHVRCYLNVHINWLVTVFPLVKERESRSNLGFSATILIHVRCRWGWTSPYEHLCDTVTSLIPYGEQIKSMYVLLGKKKSVLYRPSKSKTFMLSLHLSDIHAIRGVCLFSFL